MDKYTVRLNPKAYRDLDQAYEDIVELSNDSTVTENYIDLIEDAIISLESFPNRGANCRSGKYANKGYKQLFVKRYAVIYKVNESQRTVAIVTIVPIGSSIFHYEF